MNSSDTAKEYLQKLRENRQATLGQGVMFVDTDYTHSLRKDNNPPIPPSELMLYLHNYKMRPGESSEMQRLDMYEFLTRTATIDEIAFIKALIKERVRDED